MKISIYSYVFWPEQFLINELVEHLASRGYEIDVSTGLPNYPRGRFFDGYSILNGPYKERLFGSVVFRYPILPRFQGMGWLSINYASHLVMGLFNILRFKKSDIHFVFGTSPIMIAIPAIVKARMTGGIVCLWLQDLWPESVAAVGVTKEDTCFYRLIQQIVRWVYAHTDIVMVQSPAFNVNLLKYGFSGKVYNIPNWAPAMGMFVAEHSPEWIPRFSNGTFVVTFAGNLGEAQSIPTILKAAMALIDESNIKILLVGDGSFKSKAEKFIKKHSVKNVTLCGQRPRGDMTALFGLSSALLLTLSNREGFNQTIPSKLQAYMSAGKPILGGLDGAGAEVIRSSKCGLVSPSEDFLSLADNIKCLSESSPEELEEYGKNASAYFYKHFDRNVVFARMESVFTDIAEDV